MGLLLAGYPIVSLDNVATASRGGDLLCQAVERPLVRVRKLGGSDMYEIESRATPQGSPQGSPHFGSGIDEEKESGRWCGVYEKTRRGALDV